MRKIRTFGVCTLATFAVGLFAAGAASAEEYAPTGMPEIGRCLSKPGTGGFKGVLAKCVVKSPTKEGKWEWYPGPGANGSVEVIISNPQLYTTGGGRISCSFLQLVGKLTGGKTEKFSNLTLQGCLLVGPNYQCFSNPLEPGTIETNSPLVGELGFIPGSKTANKWVGWDLKPESELSSTIVEFFCGEGGPVASYQVSLEGSVIGRAKPTNKMVETKTFLISYKQEKGIQKPTAFIGGVEDFLTQITTPISNPGGKKTEQVGLASNGTMETGEVMEIKAKQK
jgi:hypothetical protein